jgi:hypothetical protein
MLTKFCQLDQGTSLEAEKCRSDCIHLEDKKCFMRGFNGCFRCYPVFKQTVSIIEIIYQCSKSDLIFHKGYNSLHALMSFSNHLFAHPINIQIVNMLIVPKFLVLTNPNKIGAYITRFVNPNLSYLLIYSNMQSICFNLIRLGPN